MSATQSINWSIGETAAPLPPKARGLPLLGSALKMRSDPLRYMVEQYHELGPIFRVQLLNETRTVLAGTAANRFAAQHDEEVFTNAREFAGLASEVGPIFTAASPEVHRFMRKAIKNGYSRSIIEAHVGTLVRVLDEALAPLRVGDSFSVFPTMQQIVVNQLGYVMLGQPAGEYFQDFRTFMLRMLEVYQFHSLPRLALRLPGYRRAKARAFEMARKVIADIRRNPPAPDQPPRAIDIMLAERDAGSLPLTDANLLAEAMGPYLAGQDTVAGTLTFLGYVIHKHPEVQERVAAEVRRGFASGVPSVDELRHFSDLHKTIVETMRRYPVAVFMPRHAAAAFTFAGYRVDPGTPVYSATAVTHFLPELYEDPYRFNIDRPRGPTGAWVPYGVGNYVCLGAAIADVQLMVTTAALLRFGRWELDPPGYDARMTPVPLPNPGPYRLKLVEKYPTPSA